MAAPVDEGKQRSPDEEFAIVVVVKALPVNSHRPGCIGSESYSTVSARRPRIL